MRIKTIILIIIAVLLTIVIMQNTERVSFGFLWTTFYMSKLIMLALVAIVGFILGLLVGRPKKVKRLSNDLPYENPNKPNTNTLSNEDHDYIN